ncbi:MAG: tRNA (adenosine(37)-N6)-threonylcarbamoyltransferase complex transferase subunit TsaD [Gemmatimonadetes bacterium]|nr:tRNA (adenosine(37)-N6)-threonylcarbamoyltransferase complex transferase subunit TsaD [Gemmatimonadota bacterium]NIQ57660.1 tRNA (adenosine(37)-N6)-threonylcarbamoyltransferase complex transferase subunit TsaD [Gemmatimonadota bacterium]NIU77827.1 tRNA (adenosine(37)-N6)-threonylcarbamoyltransferase complex transferase subunit TsaD [Gammaproteobacteria bacterium]NIX46955.1 tRNA (adenosine(37)-N6)-threonylcarbamoyltransferase complex transferase subunit TsaD [Gemmatimonadota bacterium]NIY1130
MVLGVETSCDETSAAVLAGDELRSHVILSQDVHKVYAGVVPELAARAHMRVLDAVVDAALGEAGMELGDVDAFGVTAGPGLIGALLVGVTWTKAAAWGLDRPVVGVHHMEAHLFAASLEDPEAVPPFVALLVSGGHTLLLWVPEWGRYELLGETRDDAAGEAFDKVARILGLDYPGGPEIEKAARAADGDPHRFPRPMLSGGQRPGDDDYYAFSFSGLKTAVLNRVEALEAEGRLEAERNGVARSFQQAVIDVLVAKTLRAVEEKDCRRVLIGGGVAASGALRSALAAALDGGRLFHPTPRMATDNGAMIARTAAFRLARGERAGPDLTARADLPFPGLT